MLPPQGIAQFQQGLGYPAEEMDVIDDEQLAAEMMVQSMGGDRDPNPYAEGAHGAQPYSQGPIWDAGPNVGGPGAQPPSQPMDKEAMREAMTQRMRAEAATSEDYQSKAMG